VDPRPAGQALRSAAGFDVYGFVAMVTAIRARPCSLRRLSVLRPPFVAMRARNPCLFNRLRLRGLYVGFISGSPVHGSARPCEAKEELGKIERVLGGGQRHMVANVCDGMATRGLWLSLQRAALLPTVAFRRGDFPHASARHSISLV
jgi:hypothetical protein